MRITVEYLVDNSGVKKGTKKNLQPYIAKDLVKRGIAKEVGHAKPSAVAKPVDSKVQKVDAKVEKTEVKKPLTAKPGAKKTATKKTTAKKGTSKKK
jgi:hypothetical protein